MIEKTANKFARELKNDITLHSVKSYVEKYLGYKVMYLGTEAGDREILKNSLLDHKNRPAFACETETSRIIFIDSTLSENDKLFLLLHECGHVLLGHTEIDSCEIDEKRAEKEANQFAYTVLLIGGRKQSNRYKKPCIVFAVLAFVFATVSGILFFRIAFFAPEAVEVSATDPADSAVSGSAGDVAPEAAENAVVYVTPHGQKYHTADCIYVKNRTDLIALDPSEAKNYEPCKVCNPPLFQ